MKQEDKEKITQAEEILERLKVQRGGNVLSIHKKWQMIQSFCRRSVSSLLSVNRILPIFRLNTWN